MRVPDGADALALAEGGERQPLHDGAHVVQVPGRAVRVVREERRVLDVQQRVVEGGASASAVHFATVMPSRMGSRKWISPDISITITARDTVRRASRRP